MVLGGFIKQKREERGLSLRDMADICGVSHTYISNIEQNKTNTVAEGVIYKLGKELDFDADMVLIDMGKVPAWTKDIILLNWAAVKSFILRL